MTICITGWNTTIAQRFREITDEVCVRGDCVNDAEDFPIECEKFLFAQGFLMPKPASEQDFYEKDLSKAVNYRSIHDICEKIITWNKNARICIIGSESGYRGSYDGSYATNKAKIHEYVENRHLIYPDQQLVGISPSIIVDSGMTERRTDVDNLAKRMSQHPMGRFLEAKEVALLAHQLLNEHKYVSGTVVRMHGGQV